MSNRMPGGRTVCEEQWGPRGMKKLAQGPAVREAPGKTPALPPEVLPGLESYNGELTSGSCSRAAGSGHVSRPWQAWMESCSVAIWGEHRNQVFWSKCQGTSTEKRLRAVSKFVKGVKMLWFSGQFGLWQQRQNVIRNNSAHTSKERNIWESEWQGREGLQIRSSEAPWGNWGSERRTRLPRGWCMPVGRTGS